jgi:hypothetical protein
MLGMCHRLLGNKRWTQKVGMFAFLVLLAVVLAVYIMTSDKEGFETRRGIANATVKQPVDQVVKRLASIAPAPSSSTLLTGESATDTGSSMASPSVQPGTLPIAPFEQTAAMSPLPYQDTTQIKANRQQLVNLLEMVKGFMAYEAQHLEERSDPTIQLPLQTARSDFYTLQGEVSVLNRNPGVQPTITITHLQDISSNLAFLQQKVRLLGSAGALQGPIYSFDVSKGQGTEGFQMPSAEGFASQQGGLSQMPSAEGFASQQGGLSQMPSAEGFQVAQEVASQKDLEDFLAKVEGERIRLSASATTDPVVQARVSALTQMRQEVREIVEQLTSGKMLPTEVPIQKADLDKAFPVLGKPSEPLPQILRSLQLPAGLANVLPSNLQKDPATARQITGLLDKYADTIVNGISATFQVSYQSPQARKAGIATSTVDKIGFPSQADLDNLSQAKFMPMGGDRPVTDRLAPLPQEGGRGRAPAHFDWKERARQIEDQIRKRGLRPQDFGVMPRTQKVSNEFSWKGYAKMMCTRLQATMDPGLPETCGCPPMDWKGWR